MFPEQSSGRLIEGVDSFVLGTGNEHQAAGRHDRAAEVFRARSRDSAGGQFDMFPEWNAQANSPVFRLIAFNIPQGGFIAE